VDARADFLGALKGLTDPEEKRNAVTNTFYANVFGRLVRETGAKFLLHGTILTDIEETVAGIKRQHNILAQLGIDPEKEYGYKVLEPLQTLRKDGVRKVAKILGLPSELAKRIPFPGPALATRIVGEVTEERLEVVGRQRILLKKSLARARPFNTWQSFLMTRPLESERTGGSSGRSLLSDASTAWMRGQQRSRKSHGIN